MGCHAKQTLASYPVSENKVINYFDLIHCDIWGVQHTKSFVVPNVFLTIVDDTISGVPNEIKKQGFLNSLKFLCHGRHPI